MQEHGGQTAALAVVDFASAARASMRDLRARVGLDGWLVARRDGDDYVVLAAVDDVFGIEAGTVAAWEDTFCARMADGSAPMVAPDIDLVPAYARARRLSGLDAKSYLSVPIASPDGEVLGTLCAVGTQVHSAGLHDQLPTVQVQAGMLGALLAHELRITQDARGLDQAGDADHIDALTGIANRRAWDAALASEELRAGRYASSTAVVVVHLDDLRAINRTAGPAAGDDLIERAARALRETLRAVDVVARLDGGAFGLLLPLTDGRGAQSLSDHLVATLTAAGIHVSVGIGSRHANKGLTQAWTDADAAMRVDRPRRAAERLAATALDDEERSALSKSAAAAAQKTRDVVAALAADLTAAQTPARERSNRGTGSVDALLRLARDQLGMDVAFLSVFEGENRRIRNGQFLIDLPVDVGFTQPSDQTHCRLIADGRVPQVTPDAMASPLFSALPVTAALGIRAFIGVPIHRRNGELYGTLCAFSQRPDATLHDRDAGVLRTLGEIAMDLVEAEDSQDSMRHEFMERLNRLYAEGGPHVVYQPVLTLEGLEQVGCEALSRFHGSDRGPAEWFAAAAAAGLGSELELRALAHAVDGLDRVTGFLALNVSPLTVMNPKLTHLLSSLPLDRIVLEMTEHEQISDYTLLTAALRPLRERGLRVAVDDAGAGFASMAHILALVPDLIKLDISLVRGIDVDLGRQALAAALTAFAGKTGARVVAEGIETIGELNCLRELGIEFGQGYYLGRGVPLPPLPA